MKKIKYKDIKNHDLIKNLFTLIDQKKYEKEKYYETSYVIWYMSKL